MRSEPQLGGQSHPEGRSAAEDGGAVDAPGHLARVDGGAPVVTIPARQARAFRRAAWGDSNALGLTVTDYLPRGRAAEEMRHVALWLTRALAEPETLKGASANASSRP